MKETGILMSAPMVRALLENRKTQTRRVMKPQPKQYEGGTEILQVIGREWCSISHEGDTSHFLCPYGAPGDRLWVKETFYCDDYRFPGIPGGDRSDPDWLDRMLYYRADGDDLCRQIPECDCSDGSAHWRPSIFMPRWASRITLEIVRVRVERVRDISADDCAAEGIQTEDTVRPGHKLSDDSLVNTYAALWRTLNTEPGKRWEDNPWVWVIEMNQI